MAVLPPSVYYTQTPKQGRYLRLINGPFEDGISDGQRKCLRKLETAGYRVEEAPYHLCYSIVSENRARKGRKYGMSLEDWHMLALERDTVYAFAVMPGFIAAALCVKADNGVLLVSGWGDISGVEKLSSVVLLAKYIYQWCQFNNFHVLDIGIAGDNEGLAAFKRRLGFSPYEELCV